MFGDNFYAEFQIETVYNNGSFPNALNLYLSKSNIDDGIKYDSIIFAIGSVYNESKLTQYSVMAPDGISNTIEGQDVFPDYPCYTGKYRIEGNLEIVSNMNVFYYIQPKNATANTKYAYGFGYDATSKELVVYFYSFNGANYTYEGLCRFDLSKVTGIDQNCKFYLKCTDSKNPDSPTDAPCVSVKANFGAEEFLFPDIAEPYLYEMKELHITENPDIDVYINDNGPKTGIVKVRKGSDVKIEAKSKDESLQDYVRIYVTPES